jgi:hypothetical protein
VTLRAFAVGGLVVVGGASAALLVALGVMYLQRSLPLGSRAPVNPVPPSDQIDSGRSWYTSAEAEALSAELATAVEGTEWCLGWSIVVVDQAQVYARRQGDVGSNRGPDRSARNCAQWVEVEATYVYTSASSNDQDNAAFEVDSSDGELALAFGEHPAYEISADDLLHEDRGTGRDDVIGNAIAGMPLVLAETGRLDPLAVEPVDEGTEGAVTFADQEGEGGSDLWRGRGHWLAAAGLAVTLGLTVVLLAWLGVPARVFGMAPATARGPDGRPVNPRRALKAALLRARLEEEQGALGRDIR